MGIIHIQEKYLIGFVLNFTSIRQPDFHGPIGDRKNLNRLIFIFQSSWSSGKYKKNVADIPPNVSELIPVSLQIVIPYILSDIFFELDKNNQSLSKINNISYLCKYCDES